MTDLAFPDRRPWLPKFRCPRLPRWRRRRVFPRWEKIKPLLMSEAQFAPYQAIQFISNLVGQVPGYALAAPDTFQCYFTEHTTGTANLTYTSGTVSFGAALDDRDVFAVVTVQENTNITDVTIDGVQAVKLIDSHNLAASPDILTEIWVAPVPAANGTSGVVTVTLGVADVVGVSLFHASGHVRTGYLDTYTKLLIGADGTDAATGILDRATGKAITIAGNAQIDTAQSKFGGGSLLLDGTGDYVTLVDSADWDFGTGDFTVEAFVRLSSLPGTDVFYTVASNYTNSTTGWTFHIGNPGGVRYLMFNYAGVTSYNAAWTPSTNTWYHVVAERVGSTLTLYVDGVSIGSTSNSTDITGATSVLTIGALADGIGTSTLAGWIDELRISKGIARYGAAFTPPTGPHHKSIATIGSAATIINNGLTVPAGGAAIFGFANDTDTTGVTWTNAYEVSDFDDGVHRHSAAIRYAAGNVTITADGATAQQNLVGLRLDPANAVNGGNDASTMILLNFFDIDGVARAFDASASARVMTFAGNAQIDTAQYKFAPSALLLDGTGDYITVPDSADWDFGTGDFAIDVWVRFAGLPAADSVFALVGNFLDVTTGWTFELRDTAGALTLEFYGAGNSNIIARSWTPSTGVWYHVAVTRVSGTVRLFVDGTILGASVSDSTNITGSTHVLQIGALESGSQIFFMNGWMQGLRISKGDGRWSANFTPQSTWYS